MRLRIEAGIAAIVVGALSGALNGCEAVTDDAATALTDLFQTLILGL